MVKKNNTKKKNWLGSLLFRNPVTEAQNAITQNIVTNREQKQQEKYTSESEQISEQNKEIEAVKIKPPVTNKPLPKEDIQQISLANPGKVIDKYGNVVSEEEQEREIKELDLENQRLAATDNGMKPGAAALIQRKQRIFEALAEAGIITPEEAYAMAGGQPMGANMGEAIGAAGIATLPAAATVGSAKLFGTAGTGMTLSSAIAGGAIVAAFVASMRSQTGKKNSISGSDLAANKKYLSILVKDLNDPKNLNPEFTVSEFVRTLNQIELDRAQLWRRSQNDFNTFLGVGGEAELAKYQQFNDKMRAYYVNEFTLAMNAPDPNRAILSGEDMEYGGE